jgi:hypothetical protein|tara:strand:- start:1487 stop:2083 length:597 start_codon:yes stop_codon:yes gene_type:complete
MPSISLTNPENITELSLGSSSETKLGGKIDLTKFVDLKSFIGASINLTSIVGFENLSKLESFNASNNLLNATPIPTLVGTVLIEFDISDQNSGDGGPTDIAEDWSVSESIMKFDISDTAIGGDDDDGAVKLKILTAFYHVFKDYDTNDKTGGQILADGTGGVITANNGFLYAPHNAITITTALQTLSTVGFTITANQF